MANQKSRTSTEDLRERIRARGLRATAPRIAVLQALSRLGRPATHAELSAGLAPDGWDRATVYRNLVDLTDAGFARRVDMGDHLWRFELIDERAVHAESEHPHFLCDSCGEVACLPRDAVRVTPSARAPRALRKKGVQIQIKGRCDRCAA
jgi:Fur family ferric uptake transcriptional regulator